MKKYLFIFSLMTIFIGCKEDKKVVSVEKNIRPVNYIVVKDNELSQTTGFSGTIAPEVLSKLSFRVSGTLIKKNVDLGDKVKKGDVLGSLDPTDYMIKYKESLAKAKNYDAIKINAQSVFFRDKILYLENSISKAQYEQSLANYDASLAQVQVAMQNVDYSKKQLDYTNLIAPASGTIAQVDAQLNESVNSGTSIYILNESGTLNVLFNVSDSMINNIKPGQKINFKVVSTETPLEAEIVNIGSISNGYGNTYPVKAKITSDISNLKVGMIVSINLELSKLSKLEMFLPINSVLAKGKDNEYVYVISNIKDGLGIVNKKNVVTGNISSHGVEITNGLNIGDYVVTTGTTILLEGDKIRLGEQEGK